MLVKAFIACVALIILWCLFSALYVIGKQGFGQKKTVKMLAWRIGLSLALFFFILIAYYLGWIHPHLIAVAPAGYK